jgi:hypothetical protein
VYALSIDTLCLLLISHACSYASWCTSLRQQALTFLRSTHQLEHLDLKGCSALVWSSSSPNGNAQQNPLAFCPHLTSLDASYAEKMVDIGWISKCASLAELSLSYCPTLSSTIFAAVATGFSGELRLQRLGLGPGFRAVLRLCVSFCAGVTDLCLHPFVGLEELDVSCCRNLRSITGLAPDEDTHDSYDAADGGSDDGRTGGGGLDGSGEGGGEQEKAAQQKGAATAMDPSGGSLRAVNRTLRMLKCGSCRVLSSLPDLHRCSALQELDFSGCKLLSPSTLVPIGRTSYAANTLQRLNLSWCPQLDTRAIAFIGKLHRLQRLDLCHCRRLTMLPSSIADCTELHTLLISNCSRLRTIEVLGDCSALRTVDTRCCPRLRTEPRPKPQHETKPAAQHETGPADQAGVLRAT